MTLDRDEVTVVAVELAAYVAGLYPPGMGPRIDSSAALEAWVDLLMAFGLPPEQFKRQAMAFALSNPGRWDPGAFAKTLRGAVGVDVGDMWELACRWVSHLSAGPVYRGGEKHEAPSMDAMLARPDRHAMAKAVRVIGLDAIRCRTLENEGTLRAQFRRVFEEAQASLTARQAAGMPLHEPGPLLPRGGAPLALPDLRGDRP